MTRENVAGEAPAGALSEGEETARGSRPTIVVIDDDEAALARIRRELDRRYSGDYRLVYEAASDRALEALEALRRAGADVALVLAAPGVRPTPGEELLTRVKELYPRARRALLIGFGAWGDPQTAEVVLRAMALGRMDYYVLKPWRSPDELFHRMVSEFLHEWSRTDSRAVREIAVVADRWSPRGHALRAQLGRNGVPHVFHASDSPEGRQLLARAGRADSEEPVVVTYDGRVLIDPSSAELARAYGVSTELGEEREFDVIIVGAGPAGLSAAVYASSEGLRTLVVESEAIGGQAGSSSLIRNYLGFPRGVSGAELAQRAYQQAWVFGTRFVLMQRAVSLHAQDGLHIVTTSDGARAAGRAVIIATGVSYRRLGIEPLEALTGAGVFYGASITEAQGLAGEDVFVVGGGNSAGQAAMHLSRYARRVHVVVRGPALSAMSQYLIDEIHAAGNIRVRLNTRVTDGGGDGRLTWLELHDRSAGVESREDAAGLFILVGASPHTGWIPGEVVRDAGGYIHTGPGGAAAEPHRSDAQSFETSVPGVFAVGDVRRGSIKRVAAAVGEGSAVIQQVHQYFTRARLGLRAAP